LKLSLIFVIIPLVIGRLPAGRQVAQPQRRGMYIVYALQSLKDERIYVGLTSNLEQRLNYYNSGKVFSTQGYRPWKLFFTEEYKTRIEARNREKQLKSGYGKEFLKARSGVAQR
jgi:putative endonuclease